MHRRFAVLGLVLAAALSVGVVIASAAQASTLNSFAYPATLTGSQTTKFAIKTDAGTFKCESTTMVSQSLGGPTSAINLTPSYRECFIAGTDPMPWSMNGCTYTLNTEAERSSGVFNGSMDIGCPPSRTITLTPREIACEITIGAQSGLKGLSFTDNNPNKGRISLSFNLTGIRYSLIGTGCGLSPGTFTDGTVTGTMPLTGSNGAISVG
jgi:hypothetical protein